jgi:nucleoside-diphosphate-sugar epimerase
VIHTAAALPLYTPEDIYTTDIDGSRNVLQSAFEHKVERCIHISSTAVYGIPDHHPLYETDQMQGVGPYGEAKVLVEEICHSYRDKGMCIPIIRPKSFVGPERLGVFALFYDWAKDGKNFPVLGSGNNRYQLLDVEDLCDAIYLTATLPATRVNDVFNIGAKEFTTSRGLPGSARLRRSRAQDRLDPRRAGDLDAARAGEGEPIAALPVGLRDSHRGFVCVD